MPPPDAPQQQQPAEPDEVAQAIAEAEAQGGAGVQVTEGEAHNARVGVLRQQLLEALEREAAKQSGLEAVARKYVTEKKEWDAERAELLAQIERLQSGTVGGARVREPQTPPAPGPRPGARPRKATKAPRKR